MSKIFYHSGVIGRRVLLFEVINGGARQEFHADTRTEEEYDSKTAQTYSYSGLVVYLYETLENRNLGQNLGVRNGL